MVQPRAEISGLTGLTGVEIDHILRFLEEKGVDPAVVDWKTIGEDIGDFADKYDAMWDKLVEHGIVIERPLPVTEIGVQEEIWKEEEEEWLLRTKEGVKELLSRIYKNNGLTKKEAERLKEKVLNRPEFATLIALYNGEEQEYAKRFLTEMVIGMPEVEVEKPKTREELEKQIKETEQRLQQIKEKEKPIEKPIEKPMIKTILIEYDKCDYQMFPVRFYDKETISQDVHTVDKWFHENILEKNKPFKSYIDKEPLTSERSGYYFGHDVEFMV